MRPGVKFINGLRRKKPCHFKWLCIHCLKNGKGGSGSCGINGHKVIRIHHITRFPSLSASKKKWLAVPVYIHDEEDKAIYLKTINKK